MILRPKRSTPTENLFPYTKLFRSPVSKSSNLSPDRSAVALRLSEIVRIAMRTGLNGRLSSIGMAEAARVGQPDAILAVGKARPFALRERGAADRWLTLPPHVHPVVPEHRADLAPGFPIGAGFHVKTRTAPVPHPCLPTRDAGGTGLLRCKN